ncbi:MAG: glycosyl hydrolase [Opitutae bacterium]|nr:glycosyl hydrolase [Opitutae bacterium]
MKKILPLFLSVLLLPVLAAQTKEADKAAEKPTAPPPAAPPAGQSGDKPDDKPKSPFSADAFASLKLRSIGPASTSGRIIDIAVVPSRTSTWYVAVASGGVWKTVNSGTTWTPVFDGEGSYSIGCVTVDPNNPNVVWVGTGENNSQRSVSYGDGVYKSLDGGASWTNTGLKDSQHVGKIVVDPRHSDTVYVTAQGPLWSAGGDRGVYKTTDGGKTWKQSLAISEYTGASDLWMDPRDSNVLYTTSYQRGRQVWGLLDGGPESAIWKSTDAGATWRKLTAGIPKVDLGRIGLAVSPVAPDVIYALIEASDVKDRGVYRSTDRGESWTKMSDYQPTSPQYYQELVPDPKNVDRVYAMDTFNKVSDDGGKTWKNLGEKNKHVDNHALWIDPANTDHLVNGNDGGVYESFDHAATWVFKPNLPVAQLYRVTADESKPFYNVYAGLQDNNAIGGPSRNTSAHGIVNADWFVTTSGDGFCTAVDPADPDILYAESQYGVASRYDRKTGETTDIQPQAGPGEAPDRWNWDSPLKLSPHSHTRVYFASQRLYRSDDRGDHWTAVSPDLTRQLDRSKLKMMGRVWGVDAVARNTSTSFYGNIVSFAESPKAEGLLYVGTDDGLVNVSEDGGKHWRKIESVDGVPENTYVSDLKPSPHDADTVYAAFDNHKRGDFKPYLFKSADRGKTWTSIAGDLPARGTVYTVVEDPVRAGLLYCGTEFGLFFSPDSGRRWVQLKGGLPTIAVRDLALQQREGDLVVGTFGRGVYILDDLTPLRRATDELLARDAALLPPRRAWMFIPNTLLGFKDKGFQGSSYFTADNPPFGAVVNYYLKDELKTKKKLRHADEKKIEAKGGDVPVATWDALRTEDREEAPSMVVTVSDSAGQVVRRLTGPVKAGFNQVVWDLRFPPANPTRLKTDDDDNPFTTPPRGPFALPGTYTVTLEKRVDGQNTKIGAPVSFAAEILGTASLPVADRAKVLEFARKVSRLQRAVLGSVELAKEIHERLKFLGKAIGDTPAAPVALLNRTKELDARLKDLETALTGDKILAKYQEPAPLSIAARADGVAEALWSITTAPTGTHQRSYEIAAQEFAPVLEKLKTLVDTDLKDLETKVEAAGAPWTPGRVPTWKKE